MKINDACNRDFNIFKGARNNFNHPVSNKLIIEMEAYKQSKVGFRISVNFCQLNTSIGNINFQKIGSSFLACKVGRYASILQKRQDRPQMINDHID